MIATFSLSAGTRFKLYGAEYEIAYVTNGKVRYASAAGGRTFKINFDEFRDLVDGGVLEIIADSQRLLTPAVLPQTIRMYRYVSAALGRMVKPTATGALREIIREVANDIADQAPPSASTVARWIRKHADYGINGLIPGC